jgi:hypothetical protein
MTAKPRKIVVPMATGLAWGNEPGCLFQQKLDGRFATRTYGDCLMAGEQMPDGSFIAFDLLRQPVGGDMSERPLRIRWAALLLIAKLDPSVLLVPFVTSGGGEFLRRILDAGGEGCVRKAWDSTWYDPMTACKRVETFLCTVTRVGDTSVSLAIDGQDCGDLALGNRIDRVRVGSVLKVEGFCRTARGKIREARPCKDSPDSWLVRY